MPELNEQTPDAALFEAVSPDVATEAGTGSTGAAPAARTSDKNCPKTTFPIRPSPGRSPTASNAAGPRHCLRRVADDDRGKDILLLDLRKATPLVDFFVIVTAASRRQTNAIAEDVDQEMKRRGEPNSASKAPRKGRRVLIDYGDFVVHRPPRRSSRLSIPSKKSGATPIRVDWHDPAKPRPPRPPSIDRVLVFFASSPFSLPALNL